MASSKKKSLRKLGIPPSMRQSRSPLPGGFSFPLQATSILDVPRIRH